MSSQFSQVVGFLMAVEKNALYEILKKAYTPITYGEDCIWFHLIKSVLAVGALFLDSGSLFAHF